MASRVHAFTYLADGIDTAESLCTLLSSTFTLPIDVRQPCAKRSIV